MSEVPTNPASTPAGSTEPSSQPQAPEAPPKWFQDYAAKVDGRLSEIGKDFGRLRDKLPKEPEAKTEAVKPSVDHRAETLAAMSLGELRMKLPAKAQAKLQARIEAGEPFTAVKAWAEDLLDSIPEQSVSRDAKPPVPNGIAASAAPFGTVQDWTQKKLTELARTDPKRFNAVMDEFEGRGISVFSLPLS